METISLPLKTNVEVRVPPLGSSQTPSMVMIALSQPNCLTGVENVSKMQFQHAKEEVFESQNRGQ